MQQKKKNTEKSKKHQRKKQKQKKNNKKKKKEKKKKKKKKKKKLMKKEKHAVDMLNLTRGVRQLFVHSSAGWPWEIFRILDRNAHTQTSRRVAK